jgi:hypothetical protein
MESPMIIGFGNKNANGFEFGIRVPSEPLKELFINMMG